MPTDGQQTINLLDLSFDELTELVVSWGEPGYRAAQIWHWIYHSLTRDPSEMSNLPLDLRERLVEETLIGWMNVADQAVSEDGLTEKIAFCTQDGGIIETVLMRYTERNTVCVSSQIGCPLGCLFCATGRCGFERDLTTGEISAQVLQFAHRLQQEDDHVSNVVFMGMGEPMLNLDAVWQAILNLNHPQGLALGMRRFTISTAGIVPGIERMGREGLPVGLAISLHAPEDELRDEIVPINRRYPLDRLLEAARAYIERTGRRVTFEYALAHGVNDSDEHAQKTAQLLDGMLCHVNLIQMNPVPGCPYRPSLRERVLRFQEILLQEQIETTVRVSRGVEIQAGCGQLRYHLLGAADAAGGD